MNLKINEAVEILSNGGQLQRPYKRSPFSALYSADNIHVGQVTKVVYERIRSEYAAELVEIPELKVFEFKKEI